MVSDVINSILFGQISGNQDLKWEHARQKDPSDWMAEDVLKGFIAAEKRARPEELYIIQSTGFIY